MPDLYGWLVFLHVAAALVAFLAHGVSAGAALKLTGVRDRAAVQALLEMSNQALFVFAGALLVLVAAGIVLGFMGGYWGQAWIWISIVLFVLVFLAMTPMAAQRFRRVREVLAQPVSAESDAELASLLGSWRPLPTLLVGLVGLLVITWFMVVRPF